MLSAVKPGDVIRAVDWNELISSRGGKSSPRPTPTGAQAGASNALDLLVLNDTGGDLNDEFSILRLDVPIYAVSDNARAPYNGVSFKAKTPNASTGDDFIVMQGKCASGKMRPAVFQGATWCKVNVSDAGHTHATSTNGDSAKLASGDSGQRILWKESGTGVKWAIVLLGGGSEAGSDVVVYFELTQDMGYADTAKLAKPVLADGTIDDDAEAFYVIDDRAIAGDGQFYGLAAYADGDSEAEQHEGYRGWGLLTYDDWSGGVPGFRIIDMEGPKDFLLVELKEDVSGGEANCDVLTSNDPGGGPDADRIPRIESTTYNIVVTDDLEIAADAKDGETWLAKWDRSGEYYIFWRKLSTGFAVIKGTSPGVTRASTTFTLGSPVAVQGKLPTGTITVSCDPKIVCPSGQTVYARYDITKGSDDASHWSTADAGNDEWILKGYPQYDAAKKMLLTSDAATVEWNEIVDVLPWLTGYGSASMVIQKPTSGTPAWEATTTNCP